MFDNFSEKSIKAVMLSQEESRRMGHNFVGTEQLLLGLIGEQTGLGATILSASGIKLSEVRFAVEAIIGRGNGFVAIEIPFTPGTKNAMRKASQAASRLKSDFVDTEHLLLGLLADKHGVGCTVLRNMRIDVDTLRSRVVYTIVEYSKHPALGARSAVVVANRKSMKNLRYCFNCYRQVDVTVEFCSQCLSDSAS